jgi:predicted metal-dependent hydrolase
MSSRTGNVADKIKAYHGHGQDAHYLAYVECFNRQLYYEAHDVLESLWLVQRNALNGAFYKGLIQLAGAFVHLQKSRVKPASSLFKLARANLVPYPPLHERLDVIAVLEMIDQWLQRLESEHLSRKMLAAEMIPRLQLKEPVA